MRWATTRSSVIARLRDPRDEDAWRTFDRLYGEAMVRYATRRGLGLDDAEDVRQTVLLSLLRSLPRFDFRRDRGRFRSYLGAVVGNAIHRHRNRTHRTRERSMPDLDMVDPNGAVDDARWEEEWSNHHLRRAVATLQRTAQARSIAVFTRLLDGERPEHVAREAGVSLESVYKVQQRLRDRLRVLVAAQIADETRDLERLGEKAEL